MRQPRQTSTSGSVARAVRPVVEGLEARQLLSVTLQNGLLHIGGTEQADRINVVSAEKGRVIKVVVNGDRSYYARSGVTQIQIDAFGGDNQVRIAANIDVPAEINGGDGNDLLQGGSGNDTIYGGAGNDTIYGGGGNDSLLGGSGIDKIIGGMGNNTLVGGSGNNTIVKSATDKVVGGTGTDQVMTSMQHQFPIFTYGGVPSGYMPQQIRQAYGLGDLNDPNYKNRGQGQAIAIVIPYHTPTLGADYRTFCSTFGLPLPTSATLQVINMAGSNFVVDENWSGEAIMDVEWAHVIAPASKIYLVEAPSDSPADISAAVQRSVYVLNKNHGGGVVSLSIGTDAPEDEYQLALDDVFSAPDTKNITFVAAAGDTGGVASAPSTNPNVIAVGGTSLFLDKYGNRVPAIPTTYDLLANIPAVVGAGAGAGGGGGAAATVFAPGGEKPWQDTTDPNGGGGGASTIYDRPVYQQNINVAGTTRVTPDVTMIADPNTGVAVYGTTDYSGWAVTGGTSLGTPMFAGIIALINQNRQASKLAKLGNTALQRIYRLSNTGTNSYFNDIALYGTGGDGVTTFTNPATRGWDFASGWGSPKANTLIYALSTNATRPILPFSAGILTFTGRASFNTTDPNATAGGGSAAGGGTSGAGSGQAASLFGLQSLTFKGRSNYYGNTIIRLNPIHMSQVFSNSTIGASSGASGGAGGSTTTVQGLVDIFGIDPETGIAAPTVVASATARASTGTALLFYRNGNTITGTAYYMVQMNLTQQGTAGGGTGTGTGTGAGTGTGQGGTGPTSGIGGTNSSTSLTFGGSLRFDGTINSKGQITGKWINVHAFGDFNPRNGAQIGGVPFQNIYNTDTGGIVMTGSYKT